jgi:hypothetical protein
MKVSIADRNFRQSDGLVYSRAFTETHFFATLLLFIRLATDLLHFKRTGQPIAASLA